MSSTSATLKQVNHSDDTTVLHESFVVNRPAREVFAYISDFATCEQWDSTAISSTRLTPGPVAVGTRYRVICALPVGSLTLHYDIIEFVPDEKVVLSGSGRFFDVLDTITMTDTGAGCAVDYTAEFTYKGGLGKLAPALEPGLRRMGAASVQNGMKTALEDNYPAPKISPANDRADSFLPTALAQFSRRGYRTGKPHWNPVSAYMHDKHIVITGATAGLGKATASALARMGAQLTLVARNAGKARQLVKELQAETGNTRISAEIADLSLMQDVNTLVRSLKKSGRPIDVLINNAGALFNPRELTSEDLEQSFALLLLSPYRLTEGLKPLLKKAGKSRVINVVSGGMYSQSLTVDDLQNERGRYSGSVAYARSKRALMVKTEQWAQDWAEEGIVVNAMHPGWADTPGVENSLPGFHKVTRGILRSAEEGADTIVWLAAATEAARVSGKLFLDREPRRTHLLSTTRESEEQRELLRKALAGWKK